MIEFWELGLLLELWHNNNKISYRFLEQAKQRLYVVHLVQIISESHDIIRNLGICHKLLGHNLWKSEETTGEFPNI